MPTDTERLDWMQSHDASVTVSDDEAGSLYVQSNRDYFVSGSAPHYDIRAAIDAAMARSQADGHD